MSFQILQFVEDKFVGLLGGYAIFGLILLVIIAIVLLIVQVDFRIIVMLCLFLVAAMSRAGWIPVWIEPIMYVFAIGYGLYLVWLLITGG